VEVTRTSLYILMKEYIIFFSKYIWTWEILLDIWARICNSIVRQQVFKVCSSSLVSKRVYWNSIQSRFASIQELINKTSLLYSISFCSSYILYQSRNCSVSMELAGLPHRTLYPRLSYLNRFTNLQPNSAMLSYLPRSTFKFLKRSLSMNFSSKSANAFHAFTARATVPPKSFFNLSP
jgi:hypothetical protein